MDGTPEEIKFGESTYFENYDHFMYFDITKMGVDFSYNYIVIPSADVVKHLVSKGKSPVRFYLPVAKLESLVTNTIII